MSPIVPHESSKSSGALGSGFTQLTSATASGRPKRVGVAGAPTRLLHEACRKGRRPSATCVYQLGGSGGLPSARARCPRGPRQLCPRGPFLHKVDAGAERRSGLRLPQWDNEHDRAGFVMTQSRLLYSFLLLILKEMKAEPFLWAP